MIPEEDLYYEEVPDEDGPARSDYIDEGFRSRAELVSRAAAAGMTPMAYMAAGKATAVTRYEENEQRAKTHGLPAGLSYDPETQILSGTPLEVYSGPLNIPHSSAFPEGPSELPSISDDEVVEGEIVTDEPEVVNTNTKIQGWLDLHGGQFFMEGFNEYFESSRSGKEILEERVQQELKE